MLKLFRTKIFLKEFRKIKFTDKYHEKYILFVSILLREKILPPESLDHALSGKYSGYRVTCQWRPVNHLHKRG